MLGSGAALAPIAGGVTDEDDRREHDPEHDPGNDLDAHGAPVNSSLRA